MGGDGGCVANNRRYMRGAGLPTTSSNVKNERETVSAAERERQHIGMTTCALSGRSLLECSSSASGVVACPYGKMYCRESAIQALLRRRRPRDHSQQEEEQRLNHDLGLHVRGIKDLFPVRLHFASPSSSAGMNHKSKIPSCPITGIELNGSVPAFLIVQSKKSKTNRIESVDEQQHPNVLSEKAIKEMGMEGLQAEYGPFDAEDLIRLVPPTGPIFDSIRDTWTDKCIAQEASITEEQQKKKDSKEGTRKKHKKDKEEDQGEEEEKSKRLKDTADTHLIGERTKSETIGGIRKDNTIHEPRVPLNHSTAAAHQAREYVSTTLASNAVLSSLFSHRPKPPT
jgi:hypothetical protein